jgi:GNAT superfamily N-acetyltransferase
MDAPEPGHYWKTPFVWEPGAPEPQVPPILRFEPAQEEWLMSAVAKVMAESQDQSDQFAVAKFGAERAVADLMAVLPEYFERPDGWWSVGIDSDGREVGFVLPVLFKDRSRWKDSRPQGTIFYMGVLPGYRGRGYALALVLHATRLFAGAGCWRISCDTGSDNAFMVRTFRAAGYQERKPWQRPLT